MSFFDFIDQPDENGIKNGICDFTGTVEVDEEGNIYVADWGNQRLQVLDSDGNFLDAHRGAADLNPWAVEYLASQDDERAARATYQSVYESDTDDPSEVSARMEAYLWDPCSVRLDDDGRV